MTLTETQLVRSNRFHLYLKQQSEKYFEENDIIPCEKCDRTGLNHFTWTDSENIIYGRGWDTTSYCDDCNGIGYKGRSNTIRIDDLHFICRLCDGIGCDECNQTGIVDWVANIMGR